MRKNFFKTAWILPVFAFTVIAWSCSADGNEPIFASSDSGCTLDNCSDEEDASVPRLRTSNESSAGDSFNYKVYIGAYNIKCPCPNSPVKMHFYAYWKHVAGTNPSFSISSTIDGHATCNYRNSLKLVDDGPQTFIYRNESGVKAVTGLSNHKITYYGQDVHAKITLNSTMPYNTNGLLPNKISLFSKPSITER